MYVQIAAMSSKVAGSSALHGRDGYGSAMAESPGDYVPSSSHGYGLKGDQFSSGIISDYTSLDRSYGDRQNAYSGRELQSESSRRFSDTVGLGQLEIYDPIDQASLLRQQQMLKAQSLQSAPLDGGARH
ncbi:protein SHORT ROOT IN SALT MEDIUM 1-like [Telopea speciosissima]|uniref:protein SHORT ROOT IN SALT MEDIUM 1-like n=1 Tax=Telopea speciosissima TaxID=54955 RepID=UPI001CC49F92|nr:protein SHORT ROOT IN SALT MEDIUM 1-like [Telopea speciosissima]